MNEHDMNDTYNAFDHMSNEELAKAFVIQDRIAVDYLKREIIKELTGVNVNKKYSRRFRDLRTLHQLFLPAFFTKSELTEYEWLESAMFEITHSEDTEYIAMRLKLEYII